MMRRPLPWLLLVMAVLLAAHLWLPLTSQPVELVAPVVRPGVVAASAPAPLSAIAHASPVDIAGDAFAVRKPPQPPAPPPPPPQPKAFVLVGPPAPPPVVEPPPPPPPQLQVVGTWDDGQSPGVFVATGQGTSLARVGTVLLAEYRVTEITAQQLAVVHIASKREWRLPVPRPAASRP